MDEHERVVQILRQWLGLPEGYETIRGFVSRKIPALRERGTIRAVWQYKDQAGEGCALEMTEEIAHDFLLFLLCDGEQGFMKRPGLGQTLLSGNFTLFLEKIWLRFLGSWLERARNRRDNPVGYLYRRFREQVVAHPEIITCRNESGQLYYRCRTAESTADDAAVYNGLAQESYSDWPLPPRPLRESDKDGLRVTSDWLSETVIFFYDFAVARAVAGRWVAVKEVVRYITTLQPWLHKAKRYELIQRDSDAEDILNVIPAGNEGSEARIERLRQLESIDSLVEQLLAGWGRVECCIFAWRLQEPPPTLKRIAEKLSLADHNQVYTIFEKLQRSLKRFCSTWPGLPLSDMAPGVAEVFVEKMRDRAKNRCDGP